MRSIILNFFVFAITTSMFFLLKKSPAYELVRQFSDTMINVSGMLFTVTGIWIAVVYPEALSHLLKNKKEPFNSLEARKKFQDLQSLVEIMIKLFLIIFSLLIINWGAVLSKAFDIPRDWAAHGKSLALGIISYGVYVQAGVLWNLGASSINLILAIHSQKNSREGDSDL